MEACYGGTDVMERSCVVARGIDISTVRGRKEGGRSQCFGCTEWFSFIGIL